MSWWFNQDYESVAEKRRKAEKIVAKLRKERPDVQPVCVQGRAMATTFWGKAWCKHLDALADHDNRLPRGRSYARHGAVCHLEIREGELEALVSGTRLYSTVVRIKPLEESHWKNIKELCAGKIGTLLELLKGKLSKEVMDVVCHPDLGIFPQPGDISFSCSCPDQASLCKHVAAVLYGAGNRLDTEPALLFRLRHVNPDELLALELPARSENDAALQGTDLGALFGIDMVAPVAPPAERKSATPDKRNRAGKTPAPGQGRNEKAKSGKRPPANRKAPPPQNAKAGEPPARLDFNALTGEDIAAFRKACGLSVAVFASRLEVTPATVYRWEKAPGPLGIQARPCGKLMALYKKMRRA